MKIGFVIMIAVSVIYMCHASDRVGGCGPASIALGIGKSIDYMSPAVPSLADRHLERKAVWSLVTGRVLLITGSILVLGGGVMFVSAGSSTGDDDIGKALGQFFGGVSMGVGATLGGISIPFYVHFKKSNVSVTLMNQ